MTCTGLTSAVPQWMLLKPNLVTLLPRTRAVVFGSWERATAARNQCVVVLRVLPRSARRTA